VLLVKKFGAIPGYPHATRPVIRKKPVKQVLAASFRMPENYFALFHFKTKRFQHYQKSSKNRNQRLRPRAGVSSVYCSACPATPTKWLDYKHD
jgi:hypothetical protein